MTRENRTENSRIPQFKNRQDEADWFDSHDMADYQDEFTTTQARFAKRLSRGITIHLDADALTALESSAKAEGVEPSTLAKGWILEHLSVQK